MTIAAEGCVLLLDKPVGPTSFDAVAAVRRGWGERRVGHTGTLDPLASGLLVICVGEATKLAPYLTDCDKAYVADIGLGRETTTGDLEGGTLSEVSHDSVAAVSDAALEAALATLRGEIEQRPPAFSAIKVGGRPLYARARAGEDVEAPVRRVVVHRLDVLARSGAQVSVIVECGKGTYIRSLAVDLGRRLGVGGHLTALRRTRVGVHSVDDAVGLAAFAKDPATALSRALRPVASLEHLGRFVADTELATALRQGKTPQVQWPAGLCLVVSDAGHLVAIAEVSEAGVLKVRRGFVPQTA